jgi:RES domain-containing protein
MAGLIRGTASSSGFMRQLRAFRISDRRFPIFDGTGASIAGGRWNSPGTSVIYAAETFAGALLEILVHSNMNRIPRTHTCIEITVPDSVAAEEALIEAVPGWQDEDQQASRAFGDLWLKEARTAVLLVPSLVTQGRERNILINPLHPDAARISASKPGEVLWDERLFSGAGRKSR